MELTKFVDELPTIPTLKPNAILNGVPYYEVTMLQCHQQLHRDLPPTTIWGYNGMYPGPTIEAFSHQLIRVCWKNQLPTKHFLPVDKTVHGAEPPNPEVRTVVHLHGGATPDYSDGYPEAWFTNDFQQVGPYFVTKTYDYPNLQPSTALWYHDHAVGITRLNIYAGLSGFYLIRDTQEQMLNLPRGNYEVPLLVQDRSFNEDGSLYYPCEPEEPVEGVCPSVVPEFFGDTILVNGKVWPYLDVEPRRYRFRLLNASNSRFYNFSLSSNQFFYQIGSDQGLLEQPVMTKEILLGPAERADIIVDFSTQFGNTITLQNSAPSPFPGGDPPNPETTGLILQIRVIRPLCSLDQSTIPYYLTYMPTLSENLASKNRLLSLDMAKDAYGREIHLLDNKRWADPITECPKLGTYEVWSFINTTEDAHPIHIHLVRFQVLDRQPYNVDVYQQTDEIVTTGSKIPPPLNERGWKDTVIANPGEITRVIFAVGPFSGLYVWHCHILEHEDHEMMLPYIVIK
ncbi:multicopper oxidase family protein [Pontibacillus yanchengensis]|uniref:Copper oxidase n=1 Tax=Pontibacillus yanchengensis Y32 TaxID=1385514 RepID=A0A0A2TFE5_9BACI|nr:multicopper oxidase [Pontibacillus yanchengensis]KGP72816.1 copper oxidase [Pontibacillus yanchengensis Y32]